jgi:DNA-binding NtrC family response regulator
MSQVILAESDAGLRDLVATRLAGKGVSVGQAADRAAALQLLKDNPGAILLLSDSAISGSDGCDLVADALRLRPELKVLIMTAHAGDPPPPAALRAREMRSMAKPFDPERLCALVVEMLARP